MTENYLGAGSPRKDWLDPMREYLPVVKPGWRPLLNATIRRLERVRCSRREKVLVAPVYGETQLAFITIGEDDVIDGILRKATATSTQMCSHCGRPGKIWQQTATVQCASCAAPTLLRRQVAEFLANLRTHEGGRMFRDDVPPIVRSLVPERYWERFGPRPGLTYLSEVGAELISERLNRVLASIAAA